MQRKDENISQRFCSECGSPKIKSWDELSGDEKFIVERMSGGRESSPEQRRRHHFCARCHRRVSDVKTDRA